MPRKIINGHITMIFKIKIENSASVRKAVLFRATNTQSSNSLAAGHGAIPSAA